MNQRRRLDVSISNRYKGETNFGEIALLDGKPRSASVIADTSVRVLVVDRTIFDELTRAHSELTQVIVLELCWRLRARSGDEIM